VTIQQIALCDLIFSSVSARQLALFPQTFGAQVAVHALADLHRRKTSFFVRLNTALVQILSQRLRRQSKLAGCAIKRPFQTLGRDVAARVANALSDGQTEKRRQITRQRKCIRRRVFTSAFFEKKTYDRVASIPNWPP